MVRGVASVLEKHHRVQVLDEAIEAAVRLSHRYIPARQLPDKAVSLLDTSARACRGQPARGAGRARGLPPAHRGAADRARDHRPRRRGRDRRQRAARRSQRSSRRPRSSAVELEERWKKERELVDRILAIRAELRKGSEPVEGTGSKLEQAAQAQAAAEPTPREPHGTEDRDTLLAELNGLHTTLDGAAGRIAADSAERRRACGGVGRPGLDRRAGRPHGQERARGGAEADRHAQPAGHRSTSRARR